MEFTTFSLYSERPWRVHAASSSLTARWYSSSGNTPSCHSDFNVCSRDARRSLPFFSSSASFCSASSKINVGAEAEARAGAGGTGGAPIRRTWMLRPPTFLNTGTAPMPPSTIQMLISAWPRLRGSSKSVVLRQPTEVFNQGPGVPHRHQPVSRKKSLFVREQEPEPGTTLSGCKGNPFTSAPRFGHAVGAREVSTAIARQRYARRVLNHQLLDRESVGSSDLHMVLIVRRVHAS